jgi:hypothetical protein
LNSIKNTAKVYMYSLTDWFVFLTQQQKDANDLLLHPMAKAIGTNYKKFAGNFNDDLLIALIYYGIAKIQFLASDYVQSSTLGQFIRVFGGNIRRRGFGERDLEGLGLGWGHDLDCWAIHDERP